MENLFASYDIALLLKNKGFNEICLGFYNTDGHFFTKMDSTIEESLDLNVEVSYYGKPTSINDLAHIAKPNDEIVIINLCEKSMMPSIEKAIRLKNNNVNMHNYGNAIFIQSIKPIKPSKNSEIPEDWGIFTAPLWHQVELWLNSVYKIEFSFFVSYNGEGDVDFGENEIRSYNILILEKGPLQSDVIFMDHIKYKNITQFELKKIAIKESLKLI